jgi:hypothetical protein
MRASAMHICRTAQPAGPRRARVMWLLWQPPIGNLITEFVPDLARHVNVHVVFVQRLIDQVAREEGAGPQ